VGEGRMMVLGGVGCGVNWEMWWAV